MNKKPEKRIDELQLSQDHYLTNSIRNLMADHNMSFSEACKLFQCSRLYELKTQNKHYALFYSVKLDIYYKIIF